MDTLKIVLEAKQNSAIIDEGPLKIVIYLMGFPFTEESKQV